MLNRWLRLFHHPIALLLACAVFCAPSVHAEDIDIFAGAAPSPASYPTLLIVLDNSASGALPMGTSTKADVAANAIAAAVAQLTDATGQINLGLLLFNEEEVSGAGTTAASDGAYVAFAARPMTSAANRAAFNAALVATAGAGGQQPSAQLTMALEEARRYAGGLPPIGATSAGARADPSALDSASGTYRSPLLPVGCQSVAVILVTNGPPSPRDTELGADALRALRGGSLPTPLVLPPPYPRPPLPASQARASNWLDEFAAAMRRTPFPDSPPAQQTADTILTHAIALHDSTAPAENDADFASGRALVWNAAIQGGGRYFDATDAASLTAAVATLFSEAIAVRATFASPALPASLASPATVSNAVYMASFRADGDRPRWSGNLKRYGLRYDGAAGLLTLVDAQDREALDASTGFITPTAQSFWSTAMTSGPILPSGSASVEFFANAPAGSTLQPDERSADLPDGEIVEKGGAAQRLRAAYLGNQSSRRVYTCPLTGCMPDTALSAAAGTRFDRATITCATHAAAFALDLVACSTELPLLVDWIRGMDNTSPNNETSPGPAGLGPVPVRPSIHGDVIHSRPFVIDYGALGVYTFYGANDGMLHAIAAGSGATGGYPSWSFIAPEMFGKFRRLRDNAPPLRWPSASSGLANPPPSRAGAMPKDYFFDGALTHIQARNGAGVMRTYLYVTARRGGASIYAFDVTDPNEPRFLWRHAARDGSDAAFDDLALTFSAAKPARVAGYGSPVVVFGGGYPGGYDATGVPLGDDADPAAPCPASAAIGCGNRIFVLDATTGAVVTTFQDNAGAGGALSKGIAGDIALVDSQQSGTIDRAYAADLGGGLWRIDFDSRGPAEWRMYKLAQTDTANGSRKFMHAPDAVVTKHFTAIFAGSGDREKPLKASSSDRFYMVKDRVSSTTVAADATGTAATWPIALDRAAADNMADVTSLDPDAARQAVSTAANNGWFYALRPGEKVVNAPMTAAGVVYFGTHQPSAATPATCSARLGVARAYGLRYDTGAPARDLDNDGTFDARDAFVTLTGGGLPPAPVGGMLSITDASTGTPVLIPFVIGSGGVAGGAASLPSQSAPARIVQKLPKSIRKTYWYRVR